MKKTFKELNEKEEESLIKAVQKGVKEEIARKLADGKPVSCYDSKEKRVYRLTIDGKKEYIS